MPDYKKGQIYRLWSPHTDKFYIGSTCSPLAKRLYEHKKNYNLFLKYKSVYYSSFELFHLGEVKIELIEDFACNNKKELERREGQLIREHKDNIINLNIAGRTLKEYRDDNKDILSEKNKEWRDSNKDKLSDYMKIYQSKNKDKISERKTEYNKIYEFENKDKISERKKQYYKNKKALLATE